MTPHPPTVLCVDDDDDVRLSNVLLLQTEGYLVREAGTGAEALSLVHEADLVVLDVRLPDLNGFEVGRRVKADPVTSLVPVILLSGVFTRTEDRARGLADAGDVYLTKPVEPREFLGQVKALLRVRRAEQALHLRDRAILAASEGIIITDPTGTDNPVTFASPGFERLTGYPAAEVVGRNCRFLQGPDTDTGAIARMRAAVREGVACSVEVLNYRRDGTPFWNAVSISPVRDSAGRVTHYVGVLADVTARKRAEEALRTSEDRSRRLLDSIPHPVWTRSADDTPEYFNRGWIAYTGLSLADSLAWGCPVAVHPDDRPAAMARWTEAVRTGGQYEAEYRLRRADGAYRWHLARALPERDASGRVLRWCGTCTDIEDQKESEVRYRQLADAMPQIVWVTRPDGYHEYYNRRWYEYTGLTYEQTKGEGWSSVFHPDDRAAAWERWRHALASGEPYEIEYRCRRHDGVYRWFLGRALPQRDDQGRLVRWFGTCTDIHDLKIAQAERLALLARLDLYIERMPMACLLSGPDFRYTRWNPAAERTFGFQGHQVVGRHPFDVIVPPQSVPLVSSIFDRLRAGDMASQGVCENVRQDGQIILCEWHNTPLFGADGAFQGIISLAQDVTDRQRAEERIRESEERFRRVVESNMVGTMFWDRSGRVVDANDAFLQMVGYTRDDLRAGRVDWDRMTPPEYKDLDRHALEEIDRTGRCTPFEKEYARPDGSRVPVMIGGALIRGGGREGVAFALDITARKRAEEAVRESEEKFRRIVETAAEGIWTVDATGRTAFANPRMAQMLGVRPEELTGRSLYDFTDDDGRRQAGENLLRREAGREGQYEFRFRRADRSEFWGFVSTSGLRDGTGAAAGALLMVTDVTGQKRLEEQFRQAQKMEAVGRLAGGVAHDFNNLLTVINGYSQLLLDRLRPEDADRELLAEISRAGERAAGLTRQLLAFSRQTVLEPKVLDPNALVREIDKLLRRVIGEDVELTTTLAPNLGRVKADAGQLEQALVNLAVNARDAMPGGGRLTVETANAELDEGYARTAPDVRPGRYVLLAVTDTGHGMDEATRARIFEPFFTTKEAGKGTGLGLAMVYGFVKQSGGHVAAYSEPGRGTTFKLYLPRADELASTGKSHPGLRAIPRGSETVLLVEDEGGVRSLAGMVLRRAGYAVLEAAGGRDALLIVQGHAGTVHLLVTDVVMPGMNGRQVADAVRHLQPGVRVLYTSGYTDDAVVRAGVLQAEVAFLPKPYTPAALVTKVREVLDAPAIP